MAHGVSKVSKWVQIFNVIKNWQKASLVYGTRTKLKVIMKKKLKENHVNQKLFQDELS